MNDEHYMGLALAQARLAAEAGEVPVGAIVVRGGQVIASGHNAPVGRKDPTAQTALAAPDVFAFGNLAGDAGNRVTAGAVARVDALDLVAVRRNLFSTASVTSPYDFDRDGRVTALDLAAARANLSRSLPATALLA